MHEYSGFVSVLSDEKSVWFTTSLDIIVFCFFSGFVVCASYVAAQVQAPPGAGDRNAGDRNIKDRSMELERIKREADKPLHKNEAANTARFEEIKEDFENIQRLQDEVLKAYTTSKEVAVQTIATNAGEINKRAIRLESNLFPPPPEEKKSSKKSKDAQKEPAKEEPAPGPLPEDLKTLIVEQDNILARFVTNPMFTNPTVANVNDQVVARTDLQRVIRLSAALKAAAEKQRK